MAKKPENPQAFPTSSFNPGMTLLDYFAGQALLGLTQAALALPDVTERQFAADAYRIADAMLAQRDIRNS